MQRQKSHDEILAHDFRPKTLKNSEEILRRREIKNSENSVRTAHSHGSSTRS